MFGIAHKRAGLTLAVLATGCVVAACGSSSSTTSTKSASASPTTTTSRTAFRTCLQQHGVTLPARRRTGTTGPGGPPRGGGGFFGGGGGAGGGQFASPKFRAAMKACGGVRRGFPGGAGGGRFRLSHTAVTNFVACVRKHGYPQMPNPNFSGRAVFPSSIRTNPKFQAASRDCQSLLVPPRSGSGTGAPAPGA